MEIVVRWTLKYVFRKGVGQKPSGPKCPRFTNRPAYETKKDVPQLWQCGADFAMGMWISPTIDGGDGKLVGLLRQ